MSSEKQLDDLKRICLICGCHTSQIINVFEQRSGPNIVELIRAKFKFQPVDEDKYLCYSCNNWLINWHSLKTLNKDTDENQLDKSRSRLNDGMTSSSHREYHSKLLPSCSNRDRSDDNHSPVLNHSSLHRHHQHQHNSKKRNGFYFPKRSTLTSFRIRKTRRKTCSKCDRPLRHRRSRRTMQKSLRSCIYCNRCARQMRFPDNKLQGQRRANSILDRFKISPRFTHGIMQRTQKRFYDLVKQARLRSATTCIPVDEKIVARLRRLGTTLVREPVDIDNEEQIDRNRRGIVVATIKSQPNRKYDTSRRTTTTAAAATTGDCNEILIDFNRVLSEVLPVEYHHQGWRESIDDDVDRRIQPMTRENQSNDVDETEDSRVLERLFCKIPKGVTISLVTSPACPPLPPDHRN